MDLAPALKSAVLRIRDSLHRYAASKGWPPDDYRIHMTVNEAWGAITVELVSRAYDGPDFNESAEYDKVLDFLEHEFKDEPELYESVGLILRPFKPYPFHAYRMYGENIVEIEDSLLNPNVKDLRPAEGPGFI